MKRRCSAKDDPQFKDYGGRGITVCARWLSYPNFLADMGRKPTSQHTIERNDTNGNYEPGNCRWATKTEQNRNQRKTIFVEFNGERLCLAEAARRAGISVITVQGRVRRGWSFKEALGLPAQKRPRKFRPDAIALERTHV
jgi:hypothetical protein